jgi:hypothetical protein
MALNHDPVRAVGPRDRADTVVWAEVLAPAPGDARTGTYRVRLPLREAPRTNRTATVEALVAIYDSGDSRDLP